MMSPYNTRTSLGLPETLERVLAYALLWVSGLILLFVEKNPTVRHHARQSVAVFGTLSVIGFILWIFGGFFHLIPLIGGLLAFPFELLNALDRWITVVAWLGLMLAAAVWPTFRLPGFRRVNRYLP